MFTATRMVKYVKKAATVVSGLVLIMVSSGILSLPLARAAAPVWYDAAWRYRIPLAIDHTKVATTLVDFPVLVSLTTTDLQKAQADGDDFVFTLADGTTKLAHDIESWDTTSGTLIAWVKVPSLSSAVDTVLYVYYGNSAAANQQAPSSVWLNGYRMVQHMDSTTFPDRSGNGTNGTQGGGVALAAGKVGQGAHFDGVDDRVVVADNAALNFTNVVTASFWFKTDIVPNTADGSENGIMGKPNDFWTDSFGFYFDLTGKLRFFVNNYATFAPAATVSATNWMYIVGVYDGSRVRLYVDGVEKGSVALTQAIGVNNKNFNIGRLSTNQYNTDGTFDEVRIANSARSAGYIATEYANQSSPATFITFGTEQSYESTRYVVVTGPSSLIAGVPQTITLTVKDGTGNAAAGFMGDATVVLSGLRSAQSGNQPTCTDASGLAIPLGNPMTLTFAAGVATCNLVAYMAEESSVDAAVGSYSSTADPGYDLDLMVIPASLNSFGLSAPATITYSQSFVLVTRARDAYFNTVTTTASTASITPSSGVVDVTTIAQNEFSDDGIATTTLILSGSSVSSPVTITVRSGGAAGSTSVVVQGIPAPNLSGTGGGINYTTGGGGNAVPEVGGPPPEDVLVTPSPLPILPSQHPTSTEPVDDRKATSTPVVTVSPQTPVVPLPQTPSVSVRPVARPTTPSRPSQPALRVGGFAVRQGATGKAIPITFERAANGRLYKKITVTNDKTVEFSIRPTGKAAVVQGFIVPFEKMNDTLVSVGQPALGSDIVPITYNGSNADGIFRATISGARMSRDSVLVTSVEYEDASRPREVTEIMLENLSGQIVDMNKKPVEKAYVTLLRKNETTGVFERWSAEDVGSANPVLTEESGHYYFAPPAGVYRLEVEKAGYAVYQSDSFLVAEGGPVNGIITLTPRPSEGYGPTGIVGQGFFFLFQKLKELLSR